MSRNPWGVGIGIALVLILVIGAGLFAWSGWGMMGPWMMGPGMMAGWWGLPFLGPIFGLVLVGLIMGGMVWVVQSLSRWGSNLGSGRTAAETPLEILKRRYASGEVTKEQFEDLRRTLEV